MSNQLHRIYIAFLIICYIGVAGWALVDGFAYFSMPELERGNILADLDARKSDLQVELEMIRQGLGSTRKDRAKIEEEISLIEHEAAYYRDWKAAGTIGHGLGIVGSLMMIAGVTLYSSRKRIRVMRQLGKLKHWLEFHIFLCLLGPTLVLFHTTFKFGGLVAVSFWSMVAVVLSGIIGRYIYTQIPRGISGNEMTIEELRRQDAEYEEVLRAAFGIDDKTIDRINHLSRIPDLAAENLRGFKGLISIITDDIGRRRRMYMLRRSLQTMRIPGMHVRGIMALARKKSILVRRIAFLETARKLFHYWHVVHQPFSIIMLVILIVHVIVTVSLGYRWIF